MKHEIIYLGASDGPKSRVWGYIRTEHIDDRWYSDSYYHVFWGRYGGKTYFQSTKNDAVFQKSAKKKRLVYKHRPTDLNDKILNEFGQYQLARKLRYGF